MSFRYIKNLTLDPEKTYWIVCNIAIPNDGELHNVLDVYCDKDETRTAIPFPNFMVYVMNETELSMPTTLPCNCCDGIADISHNISNYDNLPIWYRCQCRTCKLWSTNSSKDQLLKNWYRFTRHPTPILVTNEHPV